MSNFITRSLAPMRRTTLVANSAGGASFEVDRWTRLERFLVLGTEGGSFYASEQALTVDNAAVVDACVAADPARAIETIVDVSSRGLAPRNTPAIYALAVAASADDTDARRAALAAIGDVCRTGTHLYQFVDFVDVLGRRGWGRGLRNGIADVLTTMPLERLALHAVKYRQRDGWTYRDLLRLSHAKTDDPDRNQLFGYLVGKVDGEAVAGVDGLQTVEGFTRITALDAGDPAAAPTAVDLIGRYNLPWEAVPDQLRALPAVWEALLDSMGVIALTRNLSTLARLGLLTPMSKSEQFVVGRLTDSDEIRRSRAHPVQFLDAQLVHQSGGRLGRSRGREYSPNGAVLDALDTSYRLAFANVVPSGARTYIGLDVSGSMGSGWCGGSAVLTPRDGAAAMAAITVATEPACHVAAFSHQMVPIDIRGSMAVRDVVAKTAALPFGRTDCAQPMLDAAKNGIDVDLFVIYTDSETWFGDVHPVEALRRYRHGTGIPARLAVVGMVANSFTIADPDDAGTIDIVGFSAATPAVISAFGRGAV